MRKILFSLFFLLLFTSLSLASIEKQLIRCVSKALGSQDSVFSVTYVSAENPKFDKYFLKVSSFYPKKEERIALSNTTWINFDNSLIFSANNGREGYALIYKKDENTLIDINLITVGPSDGIISATKTGRLDNEYSCTNTTPYH